ncbi:MAG TPA: hypothetical protein VF407_14245 [Polyangiaceae bacterium]
MTSLDGRVAPVPALRRVENAEALTWLGANPAPEGASVMTSMPDVSEVPLGFDGWRAWFVDTARTIVRWLPEDGVAVFFQSDIRDRGVHVDKGYLVMRAAEDVGASVLWHKIVCRKPPGTIAFGRASYSHMIAIAPRRREDLKPLGADVLPDAGEMSWSRATGLAACRIGCRFLRDEARAKVVVDPFCGRGNVLAVANALGLDAIGVDLALKRCRAARALVVDP